MIEDEMVVWHHQLNGHEFEQAQSWWWTQRPAVLQSMGLQRVGHDWATKLNWITMNYELLICKRGYTNWGPFHGKNKTNTFLNCCCFSVAKSCPTLCNAMGYGTPGFPIQYLQEFAPDHVHWLSDVIQPSHLLSPPSPPALNLSQHQGLLQWVSSSH